MGTLIIFILIIFLLWPVIKIAWAAYRFKKRYNDFVNQTRRGTGNHYGSNRGEATSRPRPAKSKVVSPDEGEYVEWEEITVTAQDSSIPPGTDSNRRTKVSSYISERITDAEWEEIE